MISYRLFEELKQQFQIDMGIPTSDKALIQTLPKWLALAGSFGRKVVLVLDALNQLDSGAGGNGISRLYSLLCRTY